MMMKQFKQPTDLQAFLHDNKCNIRLSDDESHKLLKYVEKYGYAIGRNEAGQMVRANLKDNVEETFSIEELVDTVSGWVYAFLICAEKSQKNSNAKKEFLQKRYEMFKADEKILQNLYYKVHMYFSLHPYEKLGTI